MMAAKDDCFFILSLSFWLGWMDFVQGKADRPTIAANNEVLIDPNT